MFLFKCYYPYRHIWPPNTDKTWPPHTITDWIKIIDLSRQNNSAHDWAVMSQSVANAARMATWWTDQRMRMERWVIDLCARCYNHLTLQRGRQDTEPHTRCSVWCQQRLLVLRTQGHKDAFITAGKKGCLTIASRPARWAVARSAVFLFCMSLFACFLSIYRYCQLCGHDKKGVNARQYMWMIN